MKVGVFAASSKERDLNHEKTRTHTQKKELKERKEGKAKKETRLNMLLSPSCRSKLIIRNNANSKKC